MDGETITTPGNGATPMPKGFPPVPIRPPDPRRATDSVIGVEIGGPVESDGTLPLRCAADAVETARATWAAACELHAQELAKVNALHTEASALLKSRTWFFAAKQRTLKSCDAALGEIRTEQKALEARIARQTVPPMAKEDAGAAIVAGEVRSFLRGLSEADRLSALERAIAAGDVQIVAAALAMPVIAGLSKERADLIAGRWRRVRCPEELQRLELLGRTAAKVRQAGERLEARYGEAYDHQALDALEASTRAA